MKHETVTSFVCPRCKAPLTKIADGELRCQQDQLTFQQVDGVWRFLLPERQDYYTQFTADYEQIRRAEGRASLKPEAYRALPFADLSGQRPQDWRIRAVSFRSLVRQIVTPLAAQNAALRMLDLGAGNCWLSNQLSALGHQMTAIDLMVNAWDGLGAWRHYNHSFTAAQAEFDHLPIENESCDLVIFNSSLHYAVDIAASLTEALRCLHTGGSIVILDSPVYHSQHSGAAMVKEREAHFEATYGCRSNALPSENFLTFARLRELEVTLGIRWQIHRPFYGLQWALRPAIARLRGRREPAQFLLITAPRP